MNRKKDFPFQAVNDIVFVKREESSNEIGGLLLPDSAVKKTNRGEILSIGDTVQDAHIKKGLGKTAIFASGAGEELEEDGETFLMLRQGQILAVK